jgi:hypothetical protein
VISPRNKLTYAGCHVVLPLGSCAAPAYLPSQAAVNSRNTFARISQTKQL